MLDLLVPYVVPWLKAHPRELYVLLIVGALGTAIATAWRACPARYRLALAKWGIARAPKLGARIVGALDTIAWVFPTPSAAAVAIYHGLILGRVRPDHVTDEQLRALVDDAVRARTSQPVPVVVERAEGTSGR